MYSTKHQIVHACKHVTQMIKKPLHRTHYRFVALLMGFLSSYEYELYPLKAVDIAWNKLLSSDKYTESSILKLIDAIDDQHLFNLITPGICHYDIENYLITIIDDVTGEEINLIS